jgi:TRAP-type C4-dicarboxylate transport system permease small subunit
VSESSRQPAPREAGEVERALAAVVLGVICLITLANVVVRYFTNYSFAATEEISVALMVVLALLGSATAVARRRHIAITILIDRLPRPLKRFAEVIAETATLVMFLLLVWLGGELAWDVYRFEETSPSMGWPQWIYNIWLPILAALIAARAAFMIIRSLRS